MNLLPRRTLLAWLALPVAGCTLHPLSPMRGQALSVRTPLPPMRPPALGQQWTYKVLNFYNGEQLDTIQESVSALQPEIELRRESARRGLLPSEIQTAWGWVRQEPTWEMVQTYDRPLPLWPQTLNVGDHEHIDTHYRADAGSFRYWISARSQITALERLELSAGVFDTVRIDRLIRLNHPDGNRVNLTRTETLWLAPALGRWVVRETDGNYLTAGRRPSQGREDHLRWELVSWV